MVPHRAIGVSHTCDDVAAVCSLLDRVAPIVACPAIGSGPLGIARRVGLDQVDIIAPCAEGHGHACDDVAALCSLLDRAAHIGARPAIGSPPTRLAKGRGSKGENGHNQLRRPWSRVLHDLILL